MASQSVCQSPPLGSASSRHKEHRKVLLAAWPARQGSRLRSRRVSKHAVGTGGWICLVRKSLARSTGQSSAGRRPQRDHMLPTYRKGCRSWAVVSNSLRRRAVKPMRHQIGAGRPPQHALPECIFGWPRFSPSLSWICHQALQKKYAH